MGITNNKFTVPRVEGVEVFARVGALEVQRGLSHIKICTVEELAETDAIIFGTPAEFGDVCR